MSGWSALFVGTFAYWLPLMIGVAVGMFCVFAGSRMRRKKPEPPPPQPQVISTYDPFIQGSALENRKSLRRSGNPVPVMYAPTDDRQIVKQALVLDRSLGGLRLGAEEKVAPGTRLAVLPASATESTPWIEVDVLRVEQVEDCWELHCQFTKTPQWSILLMFG
jgi:hypothetical protein